MCVHKFVRATHLFVHFLFTQPILVFSILFMQSYSRFGPQTQTGGADKLVNTHFGLREQTCEHICWLREQTCGGVPLVLTTPRKRCTPLKHTALESPPPKLSTAHSSTKKVPLALHSTTSAQNKNWSYQICLVGPRIYVSGLPPMVMVCGCCVSPAPPVVWFGGGI